MVTPGIDSCITHIYIYIVYKFLTTLCSKLANIQLSFQYVNLCTTASIQYILKPQNFNPTCRNINSIWYKSINILLAHENSAIFTSHWSQYSKWGHFVPTFGSLETFCSRPLRSRHLINMQKRAIGVLRGLGHRIRNRTRRDTSLMLGGRADIGLHTPARERRPCS